MGPQDCGTKAFRELQKRSSHMPAHMQFLNGMPRRSGMPASATDCLHPFTACLSPDPMCAPGAEVPIAMTISATDPLHPSLPASPSQSLCVPLALSSLTHPAGAAFLFDGPRLTGEWERLRASILVRSSPTHPAGAAFLSDGPRLTGE